jgi:hypothetical protein
LAPAFARHRTRAQIERLVDEPLDPQTVRERGRQHDPASATARSSSKHTATRSGATNVVPSFTVWVTS